MAAVTPGFIVAICNAAKRAATPAGWNRARPFLAMAGGEALILLDGQDDSVEEELPFSEPPIPEDEPV